MTDQTPQNPAPAFNLGKPMGPMPGSPPASARVPINLERIHLARSLFWQNAVRDLLTTLAVEAGKERDRRTKAAKQAAAGTAQPETAADHAAIYDGRMAIVTVRGERIPIADVQPMFACSAVGGTPAERALSADIQCTIYQIRTPAGEVYTLPLSEISGLYALTPELMDKLNASNASALGEGAGQDKPFGFAAFTSVARALDEDVAATDSAPIATDELRRADTSPMRNPE
ncbi:MAG: hypothetical protein AAF747_04175 [Planctomycetota bacterium]